MRITFSTMATHELADIVAFYTSIKQRLFGRRLRAHILTLITKLKTQPRLGRVEELLTEHKQLEYRFLVQGNYKIVYRIVEDKQEIFIARIFDTRQDPTRLLD